MKEFFDKNTIIGTFLIILVLGGYFYYSKYQFQKNQAIALQERKQDSLMNVNGQHISSDSAQLSPDSAQLKQNNQLVSDTSISKISSEKFSFENNLMRFEIAAQGAVIENVILKQWQTYDKKPIILLTDDHTDFNVEILDNGQIIQTKDLVFQKLPSSTAQDFYLTSGAYSVHYRLDTANHYIYTTWTSQSGQAKFRRVNLATYTHKNEQDLKRERMFSTIHYLKEHSDATEKLDAMKSSIETIKEKAVWVSLVQQFFNVSVKSEDGFESMELSSKFEEEDTTYVKKYFTSMVPVTQDTLSLTFFAGPSSYQLLKKDPDKLDRIIPLSQDFILFRWVKVFNIYFIIPMFAFLSKFFSNYGVIIFLITLFIKLVLTPLSFKQFRSGVAMKILKPDLEKLKLKYGDDQQKFATEQMKLFSEAGVSQLGGCLPMLLQLPILFAMVSFFPASIELRQQPFLWATDLSSYDSILTLPFSVPFYGNHVSLFTILMTLTQIATTWYMSKLQPSSPQQDQMKSMMYIMPVGMMFFFNSLPAAMTFYYLLQNILSILQQWVVTKFFIDENKVREEIEFNRKNPKKQSNFQAKMQELMQQAEEQKKLQQKK